MEIRYMIKVTFQITIEQMDFLINGFKNIG